MRIFLLLLAGAVAGSPLRAAPQVIGDLLEGPDGGYYLLDPHRNGTAAAPELRRVTWGRLVDVHALDAGGAVASAPVLRDLVIDPFLQSDGVDFLLEENPVTQKTRLVILRRFRGAGGSSDPFVQLLQRAQRGLPEVQPKADAPGTAPPFSTVPRNAALVLLLDDLLADGPAEALSLTQDVKLLAGDPPTIPQDGLRIFFDANHGAVVGTAAGVERHSTRVVVDLTVSQLEALTMPAPSPLNALGLPESDPAVSRPNVSLRIPTATAPGAGQLTVLANLAGNPLAAGGGPFDASAPTRDLVRAMRSGNGAGEHKGFLADVDPPRLLGGFAANVDAAIDDPQGTAGLDFVVTLRFTSPCAAAPEVGHVLELPGLLLEVRADAAAPDAAGIVHRVRVTSLGGATTAGALLGSGTFVLPYADGLLAQALDPCWVTISPAPGLPPGAGVDPAAQIGVRFSEPMDPGSVAPYDTFALARAADPSAHDIVPASVLAAPDLASFTSVPLLPLSHVQGAAEPYFVWFGGVESTPVDLAGNRLAAKPRLVELALDANAPTDRNGGVVMRFSALDEIQLPAAADGAADVRGQVTVDRDEGVLRPRAVTRFSAVADRTQAVPSIMIPFAPGIRTPLNPLGAKLMSVWRYADVGMSSTDEATHNVDVEGLAWAPLHGQVVADVFPQFEMRLAHSHYLPEEYLPSWLLPEFPDSGLVTTTFDDNVLVDPASPQKVVHAKTLGFAIDPVDAFTATTGTPMLPWPLNQQGGPYATYPWRDTAIQAEAGPHGAGIDQKVMESVGLIPPGTAGSVAGPGEVPSIGLPLLMEFRTYPSPTSIGLNAFDVSLAVNSSRLPAFRVFSAGGIDGTGMTVVKDPDLELAPSGGFDPSSTPPGVPTPPDDNVFYVGQMDLVTRVSRAHTIWIDTGVSDGSASFLAAQVLPAARDLPAGTEIVVAWRGATAIGGAAGSGPAFDAELIDPYGAVRDAAGSYLGADGDVSFLVPGDAAWKSDLAALAGARFVQARITFVGNEATLESAALASLALAFDHQ